MLQCLCPSVLGLFFFFVILLRPLSSTLFPYTTLFRSLAPQLTHVCDRHFGIVGNIHSIRIVQMSGNFLYNSKDRKSTRLNSSHVAISYAVFCLKKKKKMELMKLLVI